MMNEKRKINKNLQGFTFYKLLAIDHSLNNRGSILIIAIWVLVMFAFLGVASYNITSAQLRISQRLKEQVSAQYFAQAAYVHATAERNNKTSEYDTLYTLRRPRKKEMGTWVFKSILIDEESKININKTSKEILSNLPGFNEELAEEITKSELYPFHIKEELLLVEGIDRDIFDGIKDIITVYGGRAVNINTAPPKVMQVLGMDENLTTIIEEYRAGPDGELLTEDDGFFESKSVVINNLREVTGLFEQQQTLLLQLTSKNNLGVAGKYFTLQVEVLYLDQPAMKYEIIMDKEKIYQWKEM
ncbi:MAG: hypothetical protein GY853_14895 [PVC group bacterium]|nr:hypothetical protein [PVC group bacterium]